MSDTGEHHFLRRFPHHSPATGAYQDLYSLAWNRRLTDLTIIPTAQWQSLQNPRLLRIPEFFPGQPSEILILKEYERVYDDMEVFFSGQTSSFLTPFDEEDALGAQWEMDLVVESEDPDTAPNFPTPPTRSLSRFPQHPGPPREPMGPDSRNRGFIVLGQPGIGKTLWLLFAVTKRLLARRPTFLQLVPGFLALFCEQGAFQFGQDVIEALDTNPNNLGLKDFYFIDSNERLITPPLSVIGTNARIIQITSPRFHRADWDRKNILRTITYFMKPLTRDEMLFASRYQSQSVPSLKDLSKFYVRYGPSARLAYAHASDQDQYEMELFKLIRAHNREELNSNLWRDLRFDFNSKVSPYLFLIRPAHDRQDCITAMISSHVCEKIKEHLADEWTLFAKEIYDACLSQPFTRSGAGEILKNRLHDLLRNGHPWHVHPMVKLSAGSDTDTVYVTESNITKRFYLHPPHLQPTDASHTRRSLELCLFDIDGLSREQISSGVYYRPLPPVQTTFDSFICDPEQEKIYVFRFTVSAKHDVQHSGLVMLEKLCPGFKIIYITFTPTFKLKLPFGKQSEQLVVEKWHAMVSSDMLFAKDGGKW